MATYYIATTGNDTTGNGTLGNPWLTVSKAITSSTTGDTIIFANGTYTWQNLNAARTFQGGSATIFDASGASTAIVVGGSNLTAVVNNIIFQNAKGGVSGGAGGSAVIVSMCGTTGSNTFNNCTFKTITVQTYNQYNGGLIGSSNAGGGPVTVICNNCYFIDIYEMATGIGQFNSTSCMFAGDGTPTTGIIRYTLNNCTFYFSQSTYNLKYIFGNRSSTSADFFITVKNCIFYNVNGNTLNFVFDSTLATNAISYTTYYLVTGVPSGTENYSRDPLLNDPANGDFNLRPTSSEFQTGTLL